MGCWVLSVFVEFEVDFVSGKLICIWDGCFGVYVIDGEMNVIILWG